MEEEMKAVLREYGRKIKAEGWKAGEPLIQEGLSRWKDFDRWARALAIMLRAKELLEEGRVAKE